MSASSSTSLLARLTEKRDQFRAMIVRRVRSEADAEDILQQALVNAARAIDTVREADHVEAWFARVVRRQIADFRLERARREARVEAFAREASDSTESEETAACACALGVVKRLRPDYADILRRVDLEDASLDEVAHALGISAGNARVRLFRARQAMRDELLVFCKTDSFRACMSCNCD